MFFKCISPKKTREGDSAGLKRGKKNPSFGPVVKNLLVTIESFLIYIFTRKEKRYFLRLVWTYGNYLFFKGYMKKWLVEWLCFFQWRSLTHDIRSNDVSRNIATPRHQTLIFFFYFLKKYPFFKERLIGMTVCFFYNVPIHHYRSVSSDMNIDFRSICFFYITIVNPVISHILTSIRDYGIHRISITPSFFSLFF